MPNGKFDDQLKQELRNWIMAEVSSQLKPFSERLSEMHDWQLGFWSNGSGRPAGFFQRRMKEDDERNTRVINFIDNAEQRQREQETRKKLEEERQQARAETWKKWAPFVKWASGILATLIVAFSLWIVPKMVAVVEILWKDYLNTHPGVTQQIKTNVGVDSEQGYDGRQKSPLDSTITPEAEATQRGK
jgi:hypothetical protein